MLKKLCVLIIVIVVSGNAFASQAQPKVQAQVSELDQLGKWFAEQQVNPEDIEIDISTEKEWHRSPRVTEDDPKEAKQPKQPAAEVNQDAVSKDGDCDMALQCSARIDQLKQLYDMLINDLSSKRYGHRAKSLMRHLAYRESYFPAVEWWYAHHNISTEDRICWLRKEKKKALEVVNDKNFQLKKYGDRSNARAMLDFCTKELQSLGATKSCGCCIC